MNLINLQITEFSQLIFLVFFFLCSFYAVWCLITFIADLNKFRLRMSDLDIEIETSRHGIPNKRDRVNGLKRWLPPRKRAHQRLTDYAFDLRRVTREVEEQEESKKREEQKQREEEEARGRIKLREWDF